MDFQRIKNYIQATGDKFVFVEDGEPTLVVMNFRDYERLLKGVAGMKRGLERNLDLLAASFETERLRRREEEASAWGIDSQMPAVPEKRAESIRLEDLPL